MPETPRNPFAGVHDFFSELSRLREVGTHGREQALEERERTHASAWVPPTDIFARDSDLVIRIELAGVRPEDVDVTFSHGVLTVSGERRAELDGGREDSFYIRERFYGAFRRVITLPDGTTESQIAAEFENGLMEITVRGAVSGDEVRRIPVRNRSSAATTRALG